MFVERFGERQSSIEDLINMLRSDTEEGRRVFDLWKDEQQRVLDQQDPRDEYEHLDFIFKCAFVYFHAGQDGQVDNCLDDAWILAEQNGLEERYQELQDMLYGEQG